jgi:glycosyltransferase involved in cell wall biosynthesis
MLGDGSLRGQLQNEARELGLGDSVLMPGHSPDVRQWMSIADVCVLPSFAEGLPLFAIECLAMGRPMVASDVDGTPEIVVDGETGLTVPPGDVAALALAIACLLRDPARAAQMASNGAKWVREQFTLDRQIRETEELYGELWHVKTGRSQRTAQELEAEVHG